jgi:hypothetical protein
MTLSTVDFDSRSDAITAAEYAGYDVSSVSVSRDSDSGRYQWNLRSFGDLTASDTVTDGETPSGADAAADVVADMVAGLGDALVVGEDDVTVTDIVVPAGWASVDGGVVQDDARVSDTPVSDVTPVVPVSSVAVAGDLVMQVFGAMPAAALGMFAQAFADKHMAIVTLRDAVTFEVRAVVTPGMGKVARRVSGGTGTGSGSGAVASVTRAVAVERDWSVWSDGEVPESNKTILRVKHGIESALASCDLDALLAFEFSGAKVEDDSNPKVSTYYRRAGRYLRCAIDKCVAELAEREAKRAADQSALDAEFGFTAIAA